MSSYWGKKTKQNKTKKTGFIDFVTAKTIQRILVKVQTF